jgi:hypothetical protein
VFVAALCAGAAMVGASVHGMLGVDAELQRSAVAAQHQTVDEVSVRAVAPREQSWDCPGPAQEPRSRHLS